MAGMGRFGLRTVGEALDPVSAAITQNRFYLLSAFGLSAMMSVLALTTSFYMLQVYDRVLSSRSIETLVLVSVIATGGIAAFGILDSLRVRILMRIGMRVADNLSVTVLRAMVSTTSQLGMPAARSGLRDVETVRNFLGSPAMAAAMDAPFMLFYMIVLFWLSPLLLAIVAIGAVILIAVALINQHLTNPGVVRGIGHSARTNDFAEDGLRNADVLEGMGMSATFAQIWRERWIEAQRTSTQAADIESRLSSTSKSVRMLIQIALLGAGAILILDFRGTGGIMIAASIIGSRALAPIDTIVSLWKSVVAARLAWARITGLLAAAPRRDEGMVLPAPLGKIEVAGAGYIARAAAKPILRDVSFALAPGETLGIIGPSASGKSTLLRLLVGAWPCTSGIVRLDGANIYTWPRTDLSKHIGYLPQDVELFDGTVRQNIARMADGDPEAVVRAAQRAGGHDMILSLPKGYDTPVGQSGYRLSGGQSQRIGIARALYGNPRLVVLDEPNSNLDTQGERALVNTLSGLQAEGVTVIVVAHRPGILANVDRMLVLNAGGTVEAFGPRQMVMQRFTRGAAGPSAKVVPLSPGAPHGADRQEFTT